MFVENYSCSLNLIFFLFFFIMKKKNQESNVFSLFSLFLRIKNCFKKQKPNTVCFRTILKINFMFSKTIFLNLGCCHNWVSKYFQIMILFFHVEFQFLTNGIFAAGERREAVWI